MNGVLSIVTAVLPEASAHLIQTMGSILDQRLPVGYRWEWVLQVDGPGMLPTGLHLEDPRLSVGHNERRLGPALSRTLALGRASGELIKVLDADDLLTPGQLEREIAVFAEYPDIAWITSKALDLLPDGSCRDVGTDPERGRIARGQLAEYWLSHDHHCLVHPASLCARAAQLRAVGGWMALPASEDTGLLLCLNMTSDGYFLDEPGLLYRKWPRQLTAHEAHRDRDQRAARHAIIAARLAAMADSRPTGGDG